MYFIPIYILTLFAAIIIDYFAAIFIENSMGRKRTAYLVLSIVSTCALLFFFKYYNFVNSNLMALFDFIHWNYPIGLLNIILPIGLSFHTFQSLSYVIEVHRGKQKAEHNFGIYALYVMFFPQLVAGPIERPQNLLHQFHKEHMFDYQQASDGLKLILWGLFKKVVIADRLAIAVSYVYGSAYDHNGYSLFIATVFFAFQIYCDFSGYSDIAIGSAQVMGFRLMDNFNRPYFSKSIGEFWKRWHISLSTWFKDYLYIPLGGNRVAKWRLYFNLMVTFVISGLWHGANWTFIFWGGLNGLYLVVEDMTQNIRKTFFGNLPRFFALYLQIGLTFSLTCIAWIFFRATSINQAFHIFKTIVSEVAAGVIFLLKGEYVKIWRHLSCPSVGLAYDQLIIAIVMIIVLIIIHAIQRHGSIRHMLADKPAVVRLAVYYALALSIVFFGMFGKNQFIYFQF